MGVHNNLRPWAEHYPITLTSGQFGPLFKFGTFSALCIFVIFCPDEDCSIALLSIVVNRYMRSCTGWRLTTVILIILQYTRKMLSSSGASLRSWHQLYSRFNWPMMYYPYFQSFSPTTLSYWRAIAWSSLTVTHTHTKKPNTQNNQDRGSWVMRLTGSQSGHG